MTTRSVLVTSVTDYLMRYSPTATADPTFANMTNIWLGNAENRWAREIRLRQQEVTVEPFTVSGRNANLPEDFLQLRALTRTSDQTGARRYLEQMTPETLRESEFWNYDVSGEPKAFCVEGDELVFAPSAAADTELSMLYFARLNRFASAEDTNALLQNHFDIALASAIVEAALFVQDLALAGTWEQTYRMKLQSLKRSENRARFRGSAAIRTGTPRTII